MKVRLTSSGVWDIPKGTYLFSIIERCLNGLKDLGEDERQLSVYKMNCEIREILGTKHLIAICGRKDKNGYGVFDFNTLPDGNSYTLGINEDNKAFIEIEENKIISEAK